ncbi:hypothetical protein AXF42_Ash016099 [Apostasia shenzhenica]|uniref:Uncharacterized protein n=1 Tax=Apostasia shenzhenica TaxID=1088818 RepID=A0A2I0B3D7_9ASPA|nr:hypothetical protein AXF42_Ash016099 [Apostasia shenzhenica]
MDSTHDPPRPVTNSLNIGPTTRPTCESRDQITELNESVSAILTVVAAVVAAACCPPHHATSIAALVHCRLKYVQLYSIFSTFSAQRINYKHYTAKSKNGSSFTCQAQTAINPSLRPPAPDSLSTVIVSDQGATPAENIIYRLRECEEGMGKTTKMGLVLAVALSALALSHGGREVSKAAESYQPQNFYGFGGGVFDLPGSMPVGGVVGVGPIFGGGGRGPLVPGKEKLAGENGNQQNEQP